MLYLLIAGVYKLAFLQTTPGGNIIKLLGEKIESGRREGKEKGRGKKGNGRRRERKGKAKVNRREEGRKREENRKGMGRIKSS